MIGTRHLGYFILHTVKPMIEEIDKILEKCKNINLHGELIDSLILRVIELEIKKSLIYCVTYIIISIILGALCYMVLR